MPGNLTANEEAQLLQTIEMFEVITKEQPLDYQSLDILKEAYFKLGRVEELVSTSKRIAQAYVQLGQLSSAILEYESILQTSPGDTDVARALAEIETKATSVAPTASVGDTEMTARSLPKPGRGRASDGQPGATEVDDGKLAMRKIFVEGRHINPADFDSYWPAPRGDQEYTQPVDPFISVLAERAVMPADKALKLLCDKSRLAYLPLERYDVDVELARRFPRQACLRWCVLPFDRLSKSILVGTANPYNRQAGIELEAATRQRLLWYLCPPAELIKALRKVFR